ncbi:hypothetical protein ACFCW7_10855 [Paenibacillus glucanolyticus]|uniref:hypothetical protein n=1 Tax=Paenibacillus glucanolyticus TaxID=59843 RepID=UPI0035DCBA7E
MWQLYICNSDGENKPFLKPFKTFEAADLMAKSLDLMPYTIRKINSRSKDAALKAVDS